jgi:hypothetical protein
MTGAPLAPPSLLTARFIRERQVCRIGRHRMNSDLRRLAINRHFANALGFLARHHVLPRAEWIKVHPLLIGQIPPAR